MRIPSVLVLALVWFASGVSAQELNHFQTLFDSRSVETRTLLVQFEPVDDEVTFAATLRDKETGVERRHEFDGQGSNDVSPFSLHETRYCDTAVILVTVEYPWRHALPLFSRVLETFAFRASDFAFIDMAFGPVTDIALVDSSHPEAADTAMQPPILVECISDRDGSPFRFRMKTRD
jgi:hypothetical protein